MVRCILKIFITLKLLSLFKYFLLIYNICNNCVCVRKNSLELTYKSPNI